MLKPTIGHASSKACIVLLLCAHASAFCQGVSGFVMNTDNAPVPFVNIFVRNTTFGTSSDAEGRYFLTLQPGAYELVFSSVGYKTKTVKVIINEKVITQNVWLESSSTELDQIVVRASRRDPAYEIIQLAIDNKNRYLKQVQRSRSKVYVKAMEVLDVKEKRKQEETTKDDTPLDMLEAARKKKEQRIQGLNLVEMQVILNYQYPDKYKEERIAYKAYGNKSGLFIPLFSETDFSIYHNLIHLKGVTETPVISPIARTSILTYKYKLEASLKEASGIVYKIKVTPRKTGNSSVSGYVYVNDSTWNINRFDLHFQKGGLRFYDAFRIQQDYHQVNDSLWIAFRQEFTYQTKQGRFKTFNGNTLIHYAEFENDVEFPPKFFGVEVAVTTKDAYEKDSSYWNSSRPEALKPDERRAISYRDSVEAAHNSDVYLDSVEARFNKVTLGEVVYHGLGFRKRQTERTLYISSLLSTVNFEVIGGFRIGPNVMYFRRFDSGRILFASTNFTVGLKNADLQGGVRAFVRYNPFRLGDVNFGVSRSFYSVNNFDAYLNQLRISNYILNDQVTAQHSIELFNGFYVSLETTYNDRQSVEDYDRTSILNSVIDETDPLIFENYQAFITNLNVSYTPAQRYMREPNQKVVLGSRYPTFHIAEKKGWNGVLGSDIDFDYVEFGVSQKLMLGVLGNSNYTLKLGKFINTKDLRYVDLRRFRQSDPYLYSDPLNSFQLLDTSLVATDLFFEAHHIHHFNGALINNIPLIKKLRIQTVAGAGALWIRQNGYRHAEIFAGIERVFKLGPRRRLRIGLYGVAAESNRTSPALDYKISFDIIDTWKRDWSY